MIRAVIADDEEEILEYLERKIIKIFKTIGADAELYSCQSGKELVKLHGEMDFNIIFLDLEMPEMDGFETAKAIRNDDPNVVLVFVTNMDDLVFNAFKYNAVAFVRKKHLNEELEDAVEQAYRKAVAKLSVQLLRTEKGDVCFKLDEILYFSSQGHNVWLHHSDGKSYRVLYTLERIESLVPAGIFVRCYSGILVNCGCIFSVDKENVMLTNGEAVALSRYRKKEVKNALQKYLRSL